MKRVVRRNRYILATLCFATILFALICGVFSIDNATNKMIVDYVKTLGWDVNPTPCEITHLTIPYEFDAVFETYNAVQKNSGFDLTKFRGKPVTRYTYRLLNHKESNTVNVMLGVLVYENRIVAGDISSTDKNGFMHALTETDYINTNDGQ